MIYLNSSRLRIIPMRSHSLDPTVFLQEGEKIGEVTTGILASFVHNSLPSYFCCNHSKWGVTNGLLISSLWKLPIILIFQLPKNCLLLWNQDPTLGVFSISYVMVERAPEMLGIWFSGAPSRGVYNFLQLHLAVWVNEWRKMIIEMIKGWGYAG